jgi:hypothetical protein
LGREISIKKILVCITTVIVLLFGYAIIGNPFKITDPSDPRFDPAKFDFCDYEDEGGNMRAFEIIFPVGTKKDYVDKILIGSGGALSRFVYENQNGQKIIAAYYGQGNRLCDWYFKNPPGYAFWFDAKTEALLEIR